jgi:hypothetical protein
MCACAPAIRPYIGHIFGRRSKKNDFELAEGASQRKNGSKSAITGSTFLSKFSRGPNSEKLGSDTDTPSQLSRTESTGPVFDLEGIKTDGFGYKVTITAERPRLTGDGEPRVRLKKRSYDFRRSSGERRWPGDSGRTTPIRGFLKSGGLKRSFSQRGKTTRPEEIEIEALKVHTRQSIEIRESFHEGDGPLPFRGFDYRNPYGRADFDFAFSAPDQIPKEREEDDAINSPSRRSSQWSLPVQPPCPSRKRSTSGSKSLAPSATNQNGSSLRPSTSYTQLVLNCPVNAPVNSSQQWPISPVSDSTSRPGTGSRENRQRRSSWSKALETVIHWGDGREKDKG